MNLADIGHLVRQRRQALGLSQARLAGLCGLSRATVNQLETGALQDLGAAKLLALLNLLGLRLNAAGAGRSGHALELVSQTASVSYKVPLQPGQLAAALADGHLPADITPHVVTLLDEAPLPLIVASIEEAAAMTQRPAKLLWKHLCAWAVALQSPRSAWA